MEQGTRRGWKRRRLALAMGTAAVMSVAVACGGDDDGGTPTPGASPTAEATASPDAGSPTAAGPTATPSTTEALMTLDEFVIMPGLTSAPYGTVVFKVKNEGELEHEFLVIKSDLHVAELPRLDNDMGADETKLDVVGRIETIPPGGQDELSLSLAPGSYVMICNLASDGDSHYLSGMYKRFAVVVPE